MITKTRVIVLMMVLGATALLVLRAMQGYHGPIKIGVVSALTGRASTAGGQARNGALLAVMEANAAGGINGCQIKAIMKDDKADPAVALTVDQELIDEGVVAIAGHLLSSMSVAAVPLMNRNNMLMVASASSTTQLTGLDDNFIRLLPSADREAMLLAKVAHERLKLNRMSILYDLSNRDLSAAYQKHFLSEFERLGGKVENSVDFDSRERFEAPELAAKLAEAKPEGVFLAANAICAGLICQHLRHIAPDIKIINSAWGYTDPAFIQHAGKAAEGVVSLTVFDADCSYPAFVGFRENLKLFFSDTPTLASQLSYESMKVIMYAVSRGGDRREYKRAILDKRIFTGLDGEPIIFDSNGDVDRTFYMLEIRNGRINTIDKLPPLSAKGRP